MIASHATHGRCRGFLYGVRIAIVSRWTNEALNARRLVLFYNLRIVQGTAHAWRGAKPLGKIATACARRFGVLFPLRQTRCLFGLSG